MFRLPVLASSHQGHPRYFGRGRQCVANGYAAMLHHLKTKTVTEWTKCDMDEVLEEGDRLYRYIKEHGQPEDYLLIYDLPVQWKGCRKSSVKRYLNSDLSVTKMYSLYLLECEKRAISPVSLNSYRHIFNTEFDLYFHKPMKDQCNLCTAYKNASVQDKNIMKQKYESHIQNKIMSREQKNDKIQAQNRNLTVACLDLEQVLMTPKVFESSLYYKRRLNTYNFSIYYLGTNDANCYVWNEPISGRGACCVYDFLQERSKNGHKNFVLYSDNCGAQNKNKYYLTMNFFISQNVFTQKDRKM